MPLRRLTEWWTKKTEIRRLTDWRSSTNDGWTKKTDGLMDGLKSLTDWWTKNNTDRWSGLTRIEIGFLYPGWNDTLFGAKKCSFHFLESVNWKGAWKQKNAPKMLWKIYERSVCTKYFLLQENGSNIFKISRTKKVSLCTTCEQEVPVVKLQIFERALTLTKIVLRII